MANSENQRIRLRFEKGGSLMVTTLPEARRTVECLLSSLPCESELVHSRYCGREVCFAISTANRPPKENQTDRTEKFDVTYWRNWESPNSGLPGSPGAEVVSFFYGPEPLYFQGEPIRVNVFGHVDEGEEAALEEIGNRIWRHGFEHVRAEIIES